MTPFEAHADAECLRIVRTRQVPSILHAEVLQRREETVLSSVAHGDTPWLEQVEKAPGSYAASLSHYDAAEDGEEAGWLHGWTEPQCRSAFSRSTERRNWVQQGYAWWEQCAEPWRTILAAGWLLALAYLLLCVFVWAGSVARFF
jgi:hypothetical protein